MLKVPNIPVRKLLVFPEIRYWRMVQKLFVKEEWAVIMSAAADS